MQMTWVAGRQQSGYDKMLLAQSTWLKFDCYLLRFPVGAEIKPHTDPVDPAYKHYRLNIVLKRPLLGGRFVGKTLFRIGKRVFLFRPDLERHAVTKVHAGTRYVLSIGWLRKA